MLNMRIAMAPYHGTPRGDFTEFDTYYMGRGEGNWTFGWGFYFTNGRVVAEHYARKLAKGKTSYIIDVELSPNLVFMDWYEPIPEDIKSKIVSNKDKLATDKAATYKDRYDLSLGVDTTDAAYLTNKIAKFVQAVEQTSITGQYTYYGLHNILGGKQEASEFLKSVGIDGNRYPSGTLSGRTDSPITNYVLFDGKDARIVGKEEINIA